MTPERCPNCGGVLSSGGKHTPAEQVRTIHHETCPGVYRGRKGTK